MRRIGLRRRKSSWRKHAPGFGYTRRPADSSESTAVGQPLLTIAPRFYVSGRQTIRPGAVMLAVVLALGVLVGVSFGMGHRARARRAAAEYGAASRGPSGGGSKADDKDDDDPNQIDTIVLGDAGDAPVPAQPGKHAADTVHPTVLVRLPRFGPDVGLIPDSPAGHLLYAWLAAFNQSSYPSLENALPNAAPGAATAAQIWLRHLTGGFTLVSAKEVQPGVLVFRLHDQTPAFAEALGTLQVQPKSNPAAIASFSLRGAPALPQANTQAGAPPPPSPH